MIRDLGYRPALWWMDRASTPSAARVMDWEWGRSEGGGVSIAKAGRAKLVTTMAWKDKERSCFYA